MDKESAYIRQILEGDVSCFSWFVETYKDMAFSIASRILANDQDAEEAVQDAFLQAYRSLGSFKGNARFSTWLYRIVVNNSISRLRKRRQQRPHEDIELAEGHLDGIGSGFQRLTSQDQTRLINHALERLGEEDRLILTLYYLDEQSLGEIADITTLSKDNVKMKLHRARKKMYGLLHKLLNRE